MLLHDSAGAGPGPIGATLQHRFVTVGDVRTVILGERPAALEALIESRRATGADRNDEVWEGDYHMNSAPRKRQAILQSRLTQILGPLAREHRLIVSADFNLGDPGDYRIPDAGMRLACVADLAPEVVDLVTKAGGVLESQLDRSLVHLGLKRQDQALHLLLGHRLQLALDLVPLA